jgi:hypothetical protein
MRLQELACRLLKWDHGIIEFVLLDPCLPLDRRNLMPMFRIPSSERRHAIGWMSSWWGEKQNSELMRGRKD